VLEAVLQQRAVGQPRERVMQRLVLEQLLGLLAHGDVPRGDDDAVEVIELASGRVQHVHVNDVDPSIARQVRSGGLAYSVAVADGLYRPLGEGGADIAHVVDALRRAGYRGWYTLDQETRLASPQDRPLGPISRSLEFLLPLLS